MPRGTKHETSDFQGREQTVKLPTNAMFTASGKTKIPNINNGLRLKMKAYHRKLF